MIRVGGDSLEEPHICFFTVHTTQWSSRSPPQDTTMAATTVTTATTTPKNNHCRNNTQNWQQLPPQQPPPQQPPQQPQWRPLVHPNSYNYINVIRSRFCLLYLLYYNYAVSSFKNISIQPGRHMQFITNTVRINWQSLHSGPFYTYSDCPR